MDIILNLIVYDSGIEDYKHGQTPDADIRYNVYDCSLNLKSFMSSLFFFFWSGNYYLPLSGKFPAEYLSIEEDIILPKSSS